METTEMIINSLNENPKEWKLSADGYNLINTKTGISLIVGAGETCVRLEKPFSCGFSELERGDLWEIIDIHLKNILLETCKNL